MGSAVWSFVSTHPFVFFSIAFSCLAVILLFIFGKSACEPDNRLGVPSEEKSDPDMTKITILARGGKIIEEFHAITHSIEWDNQDGVYIEFETKDGETITYMLGSFSAKMVDL